MSCALADPFDWNVQPEEPERAAVPAVQVHAVFRGVVTQARILTLPGAPRRRKTAPRPFTIGSQAGVDAPVAAEFVPWASHPLVMAAGDGYVVNVTPQMTGKVRVGNQVRTLETFTRDNGRTFALPASGTAQLDCGATSFIVSRTSPPTSMPAPAWRWDRSRDGYALGSAVTILAMLLVLWFIPADPRALSLDVFGRDNHWVHSQIVPVVPEDAAPPPWLKSSAPAGPAQAARAVKTEGAAGDKKARMRDRRFAIKGHAETQDPTLAKARAIETIENAGILGVLKANVGSPLASVLGADKALGSEGEDVLGHLVGWQIASAGGFDGIGTHGPGTGSSGTGDRLLGTTGLNTIGDRFGSPDGGRYPRRVGVLARRTATAPKWVITDPHVRGGLDKEIVRRVIRLHLNEIKYCYEQELARSPSLAGRIVVQFTIVPNGQVVASAVQSSTMGNARVEMCTVQAVRRWPFPRPEGGGLVTVSYPFVLAPAGG